VLVVGDARQEGPGVFERVRARYERDGLDMVTFTGALAPEDVASILSETDVFCLPSHWEGLPISVLEAMGAGAAIVATNVGELPSLLADGAGVVVPPHDPRRLAEELRRLLQDAVARDRLGRAARERVRRDFDRDAAMQDVASLYHEVAAARRTRRSSVAFRAPRRTKMGSRHT
jgi:glycosyltransferase involved in cell wall biosynthesis